MERWCQSLSEYKYWQPVVLEEHRLYAKEVAEMWGVYSTSDKLHVKMVHAILSEEEYFARKNPLYFQTKNGLVRCFGHETISKAYHRLVTFSNESGRVMVYENHGHKFKYQTKEVGGWIIHSLNS